MKKPHRAQKAAPLAKVKAMAVQKGREPAVQKVADRVVKMAKKGMAV